MGAWTAAAFHSPVVTGAVIGLTALALASAPLRVPVLRVAGLVLGARLVVAAAFLGTGSRARAPFNGIAIGPVVVVLTVTGLRAAMMARRLGS